MFLFVSRTLIKLFHSFNNFCFEFGLEVHYSTEVNIKCHHGHD